MGLISSISNKKTSASNRKVTDPVCGMEVDPAQATASLQKDDQTFYFCSNSCLEEFKGRDKNQQSHDGEHGCC